MNKFGPRVIGREAAERAETVEKARANHFGPRVIGEIFERRKRAAAAASAAAQKDSRSDPATKMAKREAAAKEAAEQRAQALSQEETVEAPITANVTELEHALANSPEMYDRLYESEKLRAEGPRKTALRLFLAFELAHADREDRKGEIEELLKGL